MASKVVSPPPKATAGAQQFPDGPGKQILEEKCSVCHAPEQAIVVGRAAAEWDDVVHQMIDLGADVPAEQAKTLVDYLAKNWPPRTAPSAPAARRCRGTSDP